MRRAKIVVLGFVAIVCAARFVVPADEPKSPPAAARDPLIEALEALQRDAADLRRQLEQGDPTKGGSPASGAARPAPSPPPAGMSSPPSGMKQPPAGMNGPAMGRPPVAADANRSTMPDVAPPPPGAKSDHWSFQPVRAPQLPAVRNAAWPAGEIDRFLLAKMEAGGLQPAADATPEALCRRVHFDLTGLPPTAEDVEGFVRASSASAQSEREKAYAALVDKLLASPRFGERWARHWLDVVRYADSVGRSWNAPLTYAWRYRDYVIDSLNADVPYDRFIAEQVAGDLLSSNDVDERRAQLTGCGLLGLGSMELRPESRTVFEMDQIDDQIDVVTRAFLGLSIACARCHDHKYDPVTMRDYYALAGIFYSTDTRPGVAGSFEQSSNGYVDPDRLVRLPSRDGGASGNSLVPGVHSMEDYRQVWSNDRKVRYTTDPNLAMGAAEAEPLDCELRIRGEAYDRGPAVPRGDLRIPSLPRLPKIPDHVSGRLELARWLGSRENPLAARVMVNRLWQHLFGRGLVATVDDFGTTGERPTHPELLDFLAHRFVDDGWSIKRAIRTIVLSRAYRLASAGSAENTAVDPDNGLYWRANVRALELEPLRDALLFVAGRLELERPYGIQVTGIGGKQGNKNLLDFSDPYRTIFLPVQRSLVPDVYAVFDFPEPTQIRGLRDATTVAPQALFFMNDRFAVGCAEDAAQSVLEAPSLDDPARVRLAYVRVFGRRPTIPETNFALTMLRELQPDPSERDPTLYRWTTFVQALLASAEFRFVR